MSTVNEKYDGGSSDRNAKKSDAQYLREGKQFSNGKVVINGLLNRDRDQDTYELKFNKPGIVQFRLSPEDKSIVTGLKIEIEVPDADNGSPYSMFDIEEISNGEIVGSTFFMGGFNYFVRVRSYEDKPKDNKYTLTIEQVRKMKVDRFAQGGGSNRDEAPLIDIGDTVVDEARSSYRYYKVRFNKSGTAIFNVRPLFNDLQIRYKVYKGSFNKGQVETLEVKKNTDYYIGVREKSSTNGNDYYSLGVILSPFDNGSEVRGIQEMLLELGYLKSVSDVNGIYGPSTVDAVKTYQSKMGLPITGIVDSNTKGRMADDVRQLRRAIAYEVTKSGLFKDLKIQAYMIEDKEYTIYNTPQLTVRARFSMFPTQGTSDFSVDMTNTNSAAGTIYSGALSADASLRLDRGKIRTALDTIGVKIGDIQGGSLRIKLVNHPKPNEFTMLLEYCKTIGGHNVYQILEMTFRNINQYSTQTAPVYADKVKGTFEVDKKEILVGVTIVLLIGMIVVASGGVMGPAIVPAAVAAMSL